MLPCKNAFFKLLLEKNHKASLLGALLRAARERASSQDSDAESRGLPAHSAWQKTAEIISFPWEAVQSESMTFKCCLWDRNECYNGFWENKGLREWASQRRALLTEALFMLKHFILQSFEHRACTDCQLIMSNSQLCIWRFLKWLTLKRADGV